MGDLDHAARVLKDAVAGGQVPGGVVLAGRGDEVLLAVAAGARRLVPSRQPMQLDTLFDLASLTKPLVTATLAMQLVEAGTLALGEPVGVYVPAFTGDGRDGALVRDLLTHSTGLPAWKNYLAQPPTDASDRTSRFEAVVADVCRMPLDYTPGERFHYSDLGFILLGYIIERVAGQDLASLARKCIFAPAGVNRACFNPPPEIAETCAATEVLDGRPLQGLVHDENARYLGGIAAHAGLFATARDVACLCQMLLRCGLGERGRVLSPAAVAAMTLPQSRHPGQTRGFGWDIDSDYSPNVRGDVFPPRGFGHSGFTGTSVWVDPPSGLWLVVLTNRVHPTREGQVMGLRRRLANVVATALLPAVRPLRLPRPLSEVRTGLEVEKAQGWPTLRGRRLGLIVNHTSIDRGRRHLLDLLCTSDEVHVARVFAPEHGLRGALDGQFADGRDEATGLPVVSLYGSRQAPAPEHLADLDALVFDIQDAGERFYTYTTTMCLAMRAAAAASVSFVVLDRPNLLRLDLIAGPILDKPFTSLAEYHQVPMIHGLTAGELARLSRGEYGLDVDLTVVPCEGYGRDLWFDQTGLPWVNPSPNLRTMKAAVLYPAIGMLERCNLSVGRGTEAPFEYLGAPWMDGALVARRLNELNLPGLSFLPVEFTPIAREFAGEHCGGCYVDLVDREAFDPLRAGLHIARTLRSLYGKGFTVEAIGGLLGSREAAARLSELADVEELCAAWEPDLVQYREARRPYLLY